MRTSLRRLFKHWPTSYPGSQHVSGVGLDSTGDQQIWEFARIHGLIIVTKDRDFREFSLDLGAPPKLIWIGLGNCTTSRIEEQLRAEAIRIAQFAETPDVAMLVLR